MKELSANEGLLYSELIYRSLMATEYFTVGGNFDINRAKVFLQEKIDEGYDPYLELCPINITRLAKQLNTTKPTIRRNLKSLRDRFLLGSDFIVCPIEILEGGYMKIPEGIRLHGRQLIFYSFLLERSRRYSGTVDTWAKTMETICGLDEENIFSLIRILKDAGYVERLSDGKLRILSTDNH